MKRRTCNKNVIFVVSAFTIQIISFIIPVGYMLLNKYKGSTVHKKVHLPF